ncbi:MAG: hypothetical protein PHW77_02765 [Eubacteriales bacterium]|nr:hypothetical protein [Eubacteriales bacterium]
MKPKAVISLLLCFLMMFVFFVGCDDSNGDTSDESTNDTSVTSEQSESGEDESSQTVSEDPYTDENGLYSTKNLPEFNSEWVNYGEFRVLVCSNEEQTTYFSEEIEPLYSTTDQVIIDGVVRRNDWIYDTYGIVVKAVPVVNVLNAVRLEISSGLDTFDAAMPFMPSCAILAREGSLFDLCDFSHIIDLDAPWWDQNATEAVSVGDKVYFTASDMTIMQKIVSSGIAFNQDLLASYFPGYNIYQDVYDGTWTLDNLYTKCKLVTGIIIDDDIMDENDMWGIIDTGPSFFYGCGEQLVTKDNNNYPIISIGSTVRSIDVAQYVLGLASESKTWVATVADWTNRTDIYGTVVKVFGEERALFMALHFSAVKKLRPYGINYGIVPAAKYNEQQDDYYTKCSAAYAYGICIPLTVADPEFSAYMCELMAIGGKNYVSNTYYNVVLKSKDFIDEDSEKMLDIIFDSIVYDPAVIYGFSGLNSIIPDLITAKSTDIVSKLDSIRDSVQQSIEELIADYED